MVHVHSRGLGDGRGGAADWAYAIVQPRRNERPRCGPKRGRLMPFIDRIGIDVGRKLPIEEAVAWAARHGVRAIDVQTDIAPNALESFDDPRCGAVRES